MSYPSYLNSRNGWVEYFAARMTSEPHLHQIEPTNHCPYSCIMCPRPEKMKRAKGFMDIQLYRSVIDQVAGYSEPVRSKEIELFHFGESLLHPQAAEMVGYAGRQNMNITLSVNPPHLTPDIAEAILRNNPYKLILSLDGYDAESYRRIRGGAAVFSKAVSNINHLCRHLESDNRRTQIILRLIRMNANSLYIERFINEWKDRGIQIEIRDFFPWSEKDMRGLGEYQKYPPFMPCPFPWQHTVVQWDGTVVPCCRDYNSVNKMGNVKDAPLTEIWNSERYHLLREQHRTGRYGDNNFCRECMDIYYTETAHDEIDWKAPRARTVSKSFPGISCSKAHPEFSQDSRVIVNPIWKLDLGRGIAVSTQTHPAEHVSLSVEETVILYWALRLKTIGEISGLIFKENDESFIKNISGLHAAGIISVSDIPFDEAQSFHYLHTGEKVLRDSEMNLPSLWNTAAGKFGKNSFLTWAGDDSIFTYEDTDTIISRTASFLAQNGLCKGDRILVMALSGPEFVFVFWAAMMLGLVVVPVDVRTGKDALLEIIRETEPKLIFTDSNERAEDLSLVNCRIVIFDNTEAGSASFLTFSSCIEKIPGDVSFPEMSGNDEAIIIFTSGTTGPNKGVVISHGGLYRTSLNISELYCISGEDRLLSTGDYNVISGIRNVCIVPLFAGASVILLLHADKTVPLKVLEVCDTYRATIINTVPAFLAYCVNAYEKISSAFSLRSLKKILCTGTTLHQSLLKRFVALFGIKVLNYYGLTETTGACVFITDADFTTDSIGLGRPYKIIAVIRNTRGEFLEDNSVGELLIYTDNIMKGYLNRPELTKERVKHGWLYTGDLAYRRYDGNIVLAGRTSDLIIDKNGDNIFPGEIEDVVLSVNGVKDAGVTGYTDDNMTERVAAFLVLSEEAGKSPNEIFNEISETIKRKLSPHKVPSKFFAVGKLPSGVSGKLIRKNLRKMVEEYI
jgi:radical SAM protein with 4Fe4S-binding SPASM domain